MEVPRASEKQSSSPSFLSGGGEMGEYIRSFDWYSTLGPIDSWPQSLPTTVSTCINSRFPILIWWGHDLVMIYNDDGTVSGVLVIATDVTRQVVARKKVEESEERFRLLANHIQNLAWQANAKVVTV